VGISEILPIVFFVGHDGLDYHDLLGEIHMSRQSIPVAADIEDQGPRFRSIIGCRKGPLHGREMRPFGFAGDVKKALQGLAGAGVFSSESAYSVLANDDHNSMIPKLGTFVNGKPSKGRNQAVMVVI
jgi:hypothetical protein